MTKHIFTSITEDGLQTLIQLAIEQALKDTRQVDINIPEACSDNYFKNYRESCAKLGNQVQGHAELWQINLKVFMETLFQTRIRQWLATCHINIQQFVTYFKVFQLISTSFKPSVTYLPGIWKPPKSQIRFAIYFSLKGISDTTTSVSILNALSKYTEFEKGYRKWPTKS